MGWSSKKCAKSLSWNFNSYKWHAACRHFNCKVVKLVQAENWTCRSVLERLTLQCIWRHSNRSKSRQICQVPSKDAKVTHLSEVTVARAPLSQLKWSHSSRNRTHRVRSVSWQWLVSRVCSQKCAQRMHTIWSRKSTNFRYWKRTRKTTPTNL